jgi:predicted phosphodiesterase
VEGRTVILSDLHLGRPRVGALSADALRPLWRGAAHLILNGDTAEVHHPSHWSVAARQTVRLFELSEQDGCELTLLSGNHDPFISDVRHLLLADGRVFVTHGDVLHPAIAPWSPAAGRLRRAHDDALRALPPESRGELAARLTACQHASYAEWRDAAEMREEARRSTVAGMLMRPWALGRVVRYWHVIPSIAARFAAEHAPDARVVLIGHTHRAGAWRVGARVVLNTGSFGFPGRPYAVVIEAGSLAFVRIRRRGDAYELDAAPRWTCGLAAPRCAEAQLDRAG